MTWSYEEENSSHNKESIDAKISERLKELHEESGILPTPLSAPKRGNICQSFWGRHWCRHLDEFSHWLQRLPRGRSLLRNGKVFDATVEEGMIHAWVAGDDLYEVSIQVTPLSDEITQTLRDEVRNNAVSLLDLWTGKLSDSLLETLTCPNHDDRPGLFPRPEDIQTSCPCLDWADVCEHSAALLYATGILFEQSPELLFLLRGIHPETLQEETLPNQESPVIQNDQLEGIFGIDISLE